MGHKDGRCDAAKYMEDNGVKSFAATAVIVTLPDGRAYSVALDTLLAPIVDLVLNNPEDCPPTGHIEFNDWIEEVIGHAMVHAVYEQIKEGKYKDDLSKMAAEIIKQAMEADIDGAK